MNETIQHDKKDAINGFFNRLFELIKDDKELHDATVRVMDSWANLQNAQAERIREKIEKER